MSFLNLVEQHDGVGVATHLLGELSALVVAHVSWRRAYESRHVEALRELAHVHAYQGILRAEHPLGEALGEVSLTHACRTKEHERAYRVVGVFQSHAVALYGFHHLLYGTVLPDYHFLQLRAHVAQSLAFSLGHALHGYARHHRHHRRHFALCHGLPGLRVAFLPLLLHQAQVLLQFGLLVAVVCRELKVLRADGFLLFLLYRLYFFFLVGDLLRHLGVLQMHARSHLVYDVYRLVGHEAVGDIAVGKSHGLFQCVLGVVHAVVLLVALLDVEQYLQGFVLCRGFYHHLLEPALQRSVFLYRLAIFVHRRGAYALYRAACQCRLHDVGCIHAARRGSCSDDCVDLVDEDYDVGVVLQFLEQGAYALLKLSAVFRACHDGGHVEAHHALVEEHGRCLVAGDELCQTLHNRALSHTGFADEYGVVLFPASENLDDALYLFLPSHHWVELAFRRSLGEVCREVVEHRGLAVALRLRGGGLLFPVAISLLCRGVVLVVIVHLLVWQSYAVFRGRLAEQSHGCLIVEVVHLKHFLCHVVGVVVQHGEQQVLHVYHLCMLQAGFEHGKSQDVACLVVEHELTGVHRFCYLVFAHFFLKLLLYGLAVDVQLPEQVGHGRCLLPQDAEQKVLWPHETAGQAGRLFSAEGKNL